MLEEDKNGTKPLYRNRAWNRDERLKSKENKGNKWYKNNTKPNKSYKTVLFVPPTPGSGLLKEMRNREKELNRFNKERIQFIEKGSTKIEKLLTKKNPFKEEKCKDKLCPLCNGSFGELKIACNTNNMGYRWICRTCEKN